MHERYDQPGRGRERNERFRGGNGRRREFGEERERRFEDFDQDDRSRSFEDDERRGRFGRFEGERSEFGGSEWRERFGGRDWEQPTFASYDERRPFAGGHGGYGERSAPRHGDSERGEWDRGERRGFPGEPFGVGGAWAGGARHEQLASHAGKGPKGYQRADERVIDDVCHALERDPLVDASEIEVSCQKGEVVLKGSVDSRQAKRRAEQCVEELPGVKDVRNELRVQPPGASGSSTGAARAR
jgi:hypothetical protein